MYRHEQLGNNVENTCNVLIAKFMTLGHHRPLVVPHKQACVIFTMLFSTLFRVESIYGHKIYI